MNKKLLTVAIAGAMAAPMSAQAVKYKLSGQVNRAIVFQDDGAQSDVRHVDSISSGTRIRLRGSEDLGNGMKAGFYWELQTSSNPSSNAFPDQNSDGNQNTNNIRQAHVWFSGNWGKLSMGQLDGAANGAVESDLSGTGITGASVFRSSFSGGMGWQFSGGGATGITHGSTYSSYDGFSRYDGIRYDTPALGPVVVSASIGNDNKWDVAARVNTALGGGQISGSVFYGENDQGGTFNTGAADNRWGGSLSYLFAQGTSITGFYSENETEAGLDSDSWGAMLGHKWGPHAVSISYGVASDVFFTDFEDSGWTVNYVHSLKKANAELYASFQHNELDTPAGFGAVEDINIFLVGARVKFD
jgi:predicted porin